MSRKGFPRVVRPPRPHPLRRRHRCRQGRGDGPRLLSHLIYDIVPGEKLVVRRPDILIVEGINVLQPALPWARTARTRVVSRRLLRLQCV